MKKIILILIILIISFFLLTANNEAPQEEPIESIVEYTSLKEESDYYTIDLMRVSEGLGSNIVNDIVDQRFSEFKQMAGEDVSELRERGFEFSYYLDISVKDYHQCKTIKGNNYSEADIDKFFK